MNQNKIIKMWKSFKKLLLKYDKDTIITKPFIKQQGRVLKMEALLNKDYDLTHRKVYFEIYLSSNRDNIDDEIEISVPSENRNEKLYYIMIIEAIDRKLNGI